MTAAPISKQAKHLEKLKAQGWKKTTVWLSPDAIETADALKARFGSLNAGLEAIKGLMDRLDAE